MHRFLSTIILAAFLASAQASLGVIVSQKQGLVFRFHGNEYGVYDERYGDVVRVSDGRIVGGLYWSVIHLGPLGRLGTATTRPWVRETAAFVLGAAGVLCVATILRRFGRGVRLST